MNWSSEDFKDKTVNIMDYLKKHKIFSLIIIIILISLICFILLINKNGINFKGKLELVGPNEIKIYAGDEYEEFGYKAYDDNIDYTKEVKVDSNLDINKIGKYKIVYKIGRVKKVRTVIVLAKPTEYYTMILNKVDAEENIYLGLNQEYIEPGYVILNQDEVDVTDLVEVKITNEVDTSVAGSYAVIYEFSMPNGDISVVKRDVIVIDPKLELTLDNANYTNTKVKINIEVTDDYFDYILLPNEEKIYEKSYVYEVNENGIYNIYLYNKKGINIEKQIEVNNIDKEKPIGSCDAIIGNGKTIIAIRAIDNIGISKYVINDKEYTTNNITLDTIVDDINIDIYDNALNKASISCKATKTDSKILLSQSNTNITNKNVNINITVQTEYFDYILLPNGTKVYDKTYSYTVDSNGVYRFVLYTTDGGYKEASIEVNNIDKEKPIGSCYGSYKDGQSTIVINSSDNTIVSKYEIEGKSYISNTIILKKEIDLAKITIYDKAGNKTNISCSLENKNKLVTSDASISFSYEYIKRDDVMPYGLFTPSSAANNKETPLIIWLHGSGERKVSASTFKNSGLLKILTDWNLEKFNSYVICPHLAGNGYSSSWNNETSRGNLNKLIEKIKQEKNIMSNKIILVGHSLGGQGVLYMGSKDNFYSAYVVLSGYNPWVEFSNITKPILGYVGNTSYGEDSSSYNFMTSNFKTIFGSNNTFVINTSHGGLPKASFVQDKNNDNKSDLIEWMLSQ